MRAIKISFMLQIKNIDQGQGIYLIKYHVLFKLKLIAFGKNLLHYIFQYPQTFLFLITNLSINCGSIFGWLELFQPSVFTFCVRACMYSAY
jgi:hypothetical protein